LFIETGQEKSDCLGGDGGSGTGQEGERLKTHFVFKRMSGYNQMSDKNGNCEEMLEKGNERLSFTYKDLFQGLMQ
jgi:hypothetical protein